MTRVDRNKINFQKTMIYLLFLVNLSTVFAGGVDIKSPTPQTKAKICAKYEGKYIAYYGEAYFVKSCKRELVSEDIITEKLQSGHLAITDVDALVIRNLPEAKVSPQKVSTKMRSCAQLEGKLVTYTTNEVYLVQKCKKRLFPEWDTFDDYSKSRQTSENSLVQLTWDEFQHLKDGEPISSLTDQYFVKEELNDKKIEVMPQAKACKGLNNTYVTYYSAIYRIENCHKRLVKDEELVKSIVVGRTLPELDSNQWISIPRGKPIDPPRSQAMKAKAVDVDLKSPDTPL